ncbi:hypothetical protein [Spiroplasma diminutum]|uniref:Uncharacterized protein n=1 Tax=Spiroplasma diminutum CUAS-1 TaxID=1276221 RepID=S5LZS7_9MOLU|nr:hypothetical protein [Spiroplasma diminutum]AGR42111.1 hypothetical protein SDIMI_v3c04070 [Spiroplasma diminutum CUAS-1]
MENINNFKNYIDEISVNWFKKFINEKIDSFRNGFLEDNDQGFGDFTPDINVTSYILNKVKIDIENIKQYNEIKNFISKYSLKIKNKDDLISAGDAAQLELLETIEKNPNNIQEKITELIMKMQINNITKNLDKSLKILESLLNKLGEETLINEIEYEDLQYILESNLEKTLEKLKKWNIENPKQSDFYKEEMKIVENDPDFEKKREASEIIEHYFGNIIGQEIDEEEMEGLNVQNINERSKIVIFNKGIMISEELRGKIELISQIYKNSNQFKKSNI